MIDDLTRLLQQHTIASCTPERLHALDHLSYSRDVGKPKLSPNGGASDYLKLEQEVSSLMSPMCISIPLVD